MNRSLWLVAGLTALLVIGCSREKAPAQQSVANIDATLASTRDAAAKYAPDELQSVDAQVASLKQNLAKGDYKNVLASAPAVNTAVTKLKQDAEARQAEAEVAIAHTKQQWRTLNADVPKMLAAIKDRVDTLSKPGRLPRGVTKASFESAKTQLASLNTTWTEATSAVSDENNEDYAGAVAKGQSVKDQAAEIMRTLGIKEADSSH